MERSNRQFMLDDDTVATAYENFCKIYFSNDRPGNRGRGWHLWEFIGYKNKKEGPATADGWRFENEDQVAKIKAIAGPHYYAICKAMEANGATWLLSD